MSNRLSSPISLLGFLLILGIAFGLGLSGPETADRLAAGFAAPPESARPWV